MKKSILVSAAIGGLIFAAACTNNKSASKSMQEGDAQAMKGECHGINECKGTGACGGADTSCAGTNTCKGKGWVAMTESECKEKGGTFKEHSK